jgi:agmatine deiminase
VVCPGFGDRADEAAREILSESYPNRDVVMLESRALFAMGGGIHCITQQQPRQID